MDTQHTGLNESTLSHAFDGISWHPDNWQRSTRSEYSARIARYAEESAGLEDADELQAAFASGLAARYNTWLAAMSRCMSWAVVGPARFPVRQQQSRHNAEHEARQRLDNWYEHQLKKLHLRKQKAAGKGPIMSSDKDAPQQIQARIDFLKELHALEIGYNKARRKGIEAASVWLKTNIPPQSDDIKKEFQKRFSFYSAQAPGGFPSYHFQLENANIKRLAGRLSEIERKREAAAAAVDIETLEGVRIERDGEANRLRIFYPDKPDEETRSRLKANGFRWSPRAGAWQSYLNNRAERFIQAEFA